MKLSIRNLADARPSIATLVGALIIAATVFSQAPAAADEPGVTQKAQDMANKTAAAVENAGNDAANWAKDIWQRIDAARLKNRTPDQLVAWVIMGILAGALAGMMTTLKPGGSGAMGRLVLGLAGAFLGGIIANVTRVNFGWGPVLIRYEELCFSFGGAIVLVVLGKILSARMKKKVPAQ